jgi:hypothetical protein
MNAIVDRNIVVDDWVIAIADRMNAIADHNIAVGDWKMI